MTTKNKIVIAFCVVVILILLGDYAKRENQVRHSKMALKVCGTASNIKYVDSKGFECVESPAQ